MLARRERTIAFEHDSFDSDLVAIHQRRQLGRDLARHMPDLCPGDVFDFDSVPSGILSWLRGGQFSGQNAPIVSIKRLSDQSDLLSLADEPCATLHSANTFGGKLATYQCSTAHRRHLSAT